MSKYRVAITGGIGSGKSTVCQWIAAQGYSVFSCDEISKELYQTKEYQKELIAMFPSCAVDGVIDQKKLAALVFSNETARASLNEFSHREIMGRLFEKMATVEDRLAFAEVPLLFEGGHEAKFDFVIVVERESSLRIQSTMQRDGLTEAEVLQRMQAQWDYSAPAHKTMMQNETIFSVQNNEDEISLQNSVGELLKLILKKLS